jgi:hypothetical protein
MPSYISAMRLRGFKSVGDRELHVDVPPGLVAVIGRYDASLPSTLTANSLAQDSMQCCHGMVVCSKCILVPSSKPERMQLHDEFNIDRHEAIHGSCMHVGTGPARAMSWSMLLHLHAAARQQRSAWHVSAMCSLQRPGTRQRHATCVCIACMWRLWLQVHAAADD